LKNIVRNRSLIPSLFAASLLLVFLGCSSSSTSNSAPAQSRQNESAAPKIPQLISNSADELNFTIKDFPDGWETDSAGSEAIDGEHHFSARKIGRFVALIEGEVKSMVNVAPDFESSKSEIQEERRRITEAVKLAQASKNSDFPRIVPLEIGDESFIYEREVPANKYFEVHFRIDNVWARIEQSEYNGGSRKDSEKWAKSLAERIQKLRRNIALTDKSTKIPLETPGANSSSTTIPTNVPSTSSPTPTMTPPPPTPSPSIAVPPTNFSQPTSTMPLPTPPSSRNSAGRIAFKSSQGGNSDIYVMNADGSNQVRLDTSNPYDDREPDWSPDGTRIAFSATPLTVMSDVYVINADGSGMTRLTNDLSWDGDPDWSPDGTQIAYSSPGDSKDTLFTSDIFVMNINGSGRKILTTISQDDRNPTWSPDGSQIAFMSKRDGNANIYVMNADGSGQSQLTNDPAGDQRPAWSPDGKHILFMSHRSGFHEIWIMASNGTSQANLTNNMSNNQHPTWSPDGTKIAYSSTADGGRLEIFVMNENGSDQVKITNNPTSDDTEPSWSR